MKKLGEVKINLYGSEFHCTIWQTKYHDGNIAIQLTTEEPFSTLSVNIPEHSALLKRNEFFAKTWSENEPWYKAVLNTGLFEDTGKRVATGFVSAQVWAIKEK